MQKLLAVEVVEGAWDGYRAYLAPDGELTVGSSLTTDLPIRVEGLDKHLFRIRFSDGVARLHDMTGKGTLRIDGKAMGDGVVKKEVAAGGVRFRCAIREFEEDSGGGAEPFPPNRLAGNCCRCDSPIFQIDLVRQVAYRLEDRGGRLQLYCEVCAPFESSAELAAVETAGMDELFGVDDRAKLLGPFELHELLGKGGMAAVYRAWDRVGSRWIALKIMRDEGGEVANLVRFHKEALLVRNLDHPGIARVLAKGVVAGNQYVGFEYSADGRTLQDVLRERGDLAPATAISWMLIVCDALAHIHEQGIVHRDIKPANLLLVKGPDGDQIRIIDFGLAHADFETSYRNTAADDILGTLYYMAPEQILSADSVDLRIDIYAAAVTLYRLLTGRLPFKTHKVFHRAIQVVTIRAPRPLREHRPELSPELEALLGRAMAKDPRRRHGSIGEFARELAAVPEAVPDSRGWRSEQ